MGRDRACCSLWAVKEPRTPRGTQALASQIQLIAPVTKMETEPSTKADQCHSLFCSKQPVQTSLLQTSVQQQQHTAKSRPATPLLNSICGASVCAVCPSQQPRGVVSGAERVTVPGWPAAGHAEVSPERAGAKTCEGRSRPPSRLGCS